MGKTTKPVEKGDVTGDAEGERRRHISSLQKAIDQALCSLQSNTVKGSEEWKELEMLKEDISRETKPVVLYHKLKILEQVINEESRGIIS